ncbi:unnamed protein product [Allacma fusca]|uniref:NADPH-dependent FMN reductase-like domain-containing protein n=1 Tax=Allacma fusca TaxID=39272 RepID=A0A8J2KVH3_9HEXA|nr:unnamed protein product [Allacma fusca]
MATPNKLKIVVFYGSTRTGRLVERVGAFVKKVLVDKGLEPLIFDPEEMNFEMLKCALHFYPNRDDAPQWLKDADAVIRDADGFLVVSTEYNSSIPPALSNMLDHFPPASFRHRPVGILTYAKGYWGGIRAGVVLKPFLSDFGLVTIPANCPIPTAGEVFDAAGNCKEERIAKRVERLVNELRWYSAALKSYRSIETLPPPPMNALA